MPISFQKALGRALILTGALAVAFWGELVLKQFWIQRAALHRLASEVTHVQQGSRQADRPEGGSESKPSMGEIIGQLEIPRIHISVVVLEGSRPSILDVAAGHIEGTALP